MAKSKNGGTRSFIKGRIGSDVYTVGKNGKGERQQVVRSLAESVANPRSESQMFGRMIMSTVMQAVSGLAPIIDHSFDGIAKGQPSISEFIRRNYALVKADAVAHPASGNSFELSKFQEKGCKVGYYAISTGTVVKPAAVTSEGATLHIALTSETLTVGGLKAALGLSADGFLTLVYVGPSVGAIYVRAKVDTTLADSTAITSSNVASLFVLEGNYTAAASLNTNTIDIKLGNLDEDYFASGVIVSEKMDGEWKHNTCTLAGYGISGKQPADEVLPTYPTGAEQFLNGGTL